MATTYYKKHKISKGETIAQSLKERFDYGQNPDKTEDGELISSYGCDHMTADAEFLLSKAKYKADTGREQLRLAINEALAKRPADFDAFLRLMEVSGFTVKHGRGGVLSFLVPGQERATRLRASTLGDGYDPEDIKAVIAGERPLPEQPVPAPAAPRRVNLIVDIQERLRSGKGAAYARWAKVYNLKQMAAALQFMQEQNITE